MRRAPKWIVVLATLVAIGSVVAAITITSNLLQRQQKVWKPMSAVTDPETFPELLMDDTSIDFHFWVNVTNPETNPGSVFSTKVNITLTSTCPEGAQVIIVQALPTAGPAGQDLCQDSSWESSTQDIGPGEMKSWKFRLTYDEEGTYTYDIVARGQSTT